MPRKSVAHKPTISIVGPGNLGSALAVTLAAAEFRVHSLLIRAGSKRTGETKRLAGRIGAKVSQTGAHPGPADILWITVPDDAIADAARVLSQSGDWRGRIVFHSSGALTSDELSPLRTKGARVASVHPMMTFVHGEVPEMSGVSFAVEGDRAAVRAARSIVESLGGRSFVIKKQNKVLYHVFGSFASPLVIALLATMEDVAQAAGFRKQDIKPVVGPLLWQTLQNYQKRGAAKAFSGPLVRGDVATVSKHLAELADLPHAVQVYRALAHSAVQRLPVKNAGTMESRLSRPRKRARSQ